MSNKENVLVVGAACSFGVALAENILNEYSGIVLAEQEQKASELQDIVEKLLREYPQKHIYMLIVDVRNVNDILKRILELENRQITIDKFVFCAGINILLNALEVTEKIWDEVLDVNLKGFFFMAQAVIAYMLRNGIQGSIVAIASQHGVVANYDRAPYCSAKAGMIHLVKELALEFAEEGIRINAVSPSFVKTVANEKILDTARSEKEYLSQIPLKRYASGQDVSNAVIFLLSEKSNYLTGTNLLVDGGYTLK